MTNLLKILHLEDLQSDAELTIRELGKSDLRFDLKLVDNRSDFENALMEYRPDVIISDHSLPSFNSLEALEMVKRSGSGIPFILLTATISEEFAVEIMRAGASDYVLKDRMQRLPQAIMNAMEKWEAEIKRVTAEQELQAAHDRLLFHLENAPLGFIEWDTHARIRSWSDRAEDIFGWSESEFKLQQIDGYRLIHPDDVEWVNRIAEEMLAGEIHRIKFQCRCYRKDEKLIWCEWFNSSFRDDNGKVQTIMSLVQDITEQKTLEIERSKMISDILQRNKDLEQFTYIVSHNLRAPVANIIGFTSALLYPGLSEEMKSEFISGLSTSSRRLDEVTNDLNTILQVKGQLNESREQIRLSEIISNIRFSIANLIEKENVKIVIDLSESDELVAVKSYVYSIFYNLISNSIRYRNPGLDPEIRISAKHIASMVVIKYSDNGLGIDVETHGSNIFGLYKRFHTHIEGKGMGLFMIKSQVESLGGKIFLKSETNKGVEFTIELPI